MIQDLLQRIIVLLLMATPKLDLDFGSTCLGAGLGILDDSLRELGRVVGLSAPRYINIYICVCVCV